MTNKKIVFFFLLPVLLSFILHFRVLKLDVIGYHVWRQSQTQTVIYNFNFSDNSIFHPQKLDLGDGGAALLFEFPLYQWLIAQVNNVFGYSVLHTRLLTFLFFIGILLGFYNLVRNFVSQKIALIANCLLCFSPLLYFYCVNPLPDILALCCATWSLNFFIAFSRHQSSVQFLLFCLFLLLAALVKLPFIIFGSVFVLYVFSNLKRGRLKEVFIKSVILCLSLIPALLWYLKAIPTWRDKGTVFGLTQHSKSWLHLLDCFQFNLFSSAPELITNYASCLFLGAGIFLFFKRFEHLKNKYTYFMTLFAAASVYFFFELNMIEKTHDYYLMPFVPLIFLVVTYGLNFFYNSKYRMVVFVAVCLVPLTAWLRIDHRWSINDPGFVRDYMTSQAELQAIVPPNEKCIIDHDDSHFIALYYLKRRGYSLYKNEISPGVLKTRYDEGAHFFVTENLSINLADYKAFKFEPLYDKNLRVYKLSLN